MVNEFVSAPCQRNWEPVKVYGRLLAIDPGQFSPFEPETV
jgi:hypothetical protein